MPTPRPLIKGLALAIDLGFIVVHLVEAGTADHECCYGGAGVGMRGSGAIGRNGDMEGYEGFTGHIGGVVVG